MTLTPKQRNNATAVTCMVISLILGIEGFFALSSVLNSQHNTSKRISYTEPIETEPIFFEPELIASHAIVYDIKNDEILFEKNPYHIKPVASITKVVSALVSSELLDPYQSIQIDSKALAQDSDNGLLLHESWSFSNLLDFSLLVSSNDGAYAIANIAGAFNKPTTASTTESVDAFVQLMNKKMSELGLRNTYFNNPSGLDVNEYESGGYSTAFEIAKLFEYITENKYGILEATALQHVYLPSKNNIIHHATNTNEGHSEIPALIASKTGYTDLAGGNLAIVFDTGVNHPIAVVVLSSTYFDRFSDVTKLVNSTTQYFAR